MNAEELNQRDVKRNIRLKSALRKIIASGLSDEIHLEENKDLISELAHEYIDQKPVYTSSQMKEMIQRTRSWVLNNPDTELPYIPVEWSDKVSPLENKIASINTMPPYRETHWIIKLLIWLRIF